MEKRTREFGIRPIGRLLLSQSVPPIVGMLVLAIYNIVDTIFIGRGVGSLGIGGAAIALPITMIIQGVALMFGIGSASVISRSLGSSDHEKANRTFTSFLFLVVSASLLLTGVVYVFLGPLLTLFGATASIMPFARQYLAIVVGGMPLFGFAVASSHIIRSEGSPRRAMFVLLVGSLVNMALDPILIFGLGWGMAGAAWATVASYVVSAVIAAEHFTGGHSALRVVRACTVCWEHVKEVSVVGAPTLMRTVSMNIIAIVINVALAKQGGDLAIAAYGIINRLVMFVILPVIGIIQGMQPIVGYNYGSGRLDRVRGTVRLSIKASTIITVVSYAAFMVFTKTIVGIFTTDASLVLMASHALRLVILLFPFVGFQVVASGYFQALGEAKEALVLALLRQVILLLPIVLVLPTYLGLEGVWWSFPIADGVAALITAWLLARGLRSLSASGARRTPSRS